MTNWFLGRQRSVKAALTVGTFVLTAFGSSLVGSCGGGIAPPPPATAKVALSTNSIVIQSTTTSAAPAPIEVSVTNGGSGDLAGLTATSDHTWLGVTLASTTAPTKLTLVVNTVGLAVGSQIATVTVGSTASLANGPQAVTVTVNQAQGVVSYTIAASASPTVGGTTTGNGTYPAGTPVTVTATPAAGYSFSNWTEGGTAVSTSAIYTFNASANRTLVANFTVNPAGLTVLTAGGGNGTVSSSPSGINCTSTAGVSSGTCSAGYTLGTPVTLTAAPTAGHTFGGWTGPCSGTGVCQLTMSQGLIVAASFTAPVVVRYNVAVSAAPTFAGTVTGAGSYDKDTPVTVAAVPASGFAFSTWTENGTIVSLAPTFQFPATANRTLQANFNIAQTTNYTLTINSSALAGESGKVTSADGRISCVITFTTKSGTCSATYVSGSSVTLTLFRDFTWFGMDWSSDGANDCKGSLVANDPRQSQTCIVAMSASRTVTVNYR